MKTIDQEEAAFALFSEGAAPMAIPAARVLGIIELPALWSVPRPAPSVMGFFRHAGRLVPAIRLAEALGVEAGVPRYAILVEDEATVIALAVEQVDAAIRVPLSSLRHGSFGAATLPARFVRAVIEAGADVPVLNLAALAARHRPRLADSGESEALAIEALESVIGG